MTDLDLAPEAPAAPDATAEPAAPNGRRFALDDFGRWLLLLTLAGLALRLAFVLIGQHDVPLGRGDSYYYHRGSELLLQGHGFVAPHQWDQGIEMQAASHPPVYLIYLAAFSALGMQTPLWHMAASCLLGAASVAFVGFLGKRLGGARVGLIAAGLAVVYPQIWVNDGMLMSETAAICFGLLALLTCYRYSEDRTPRRAFLMGLAIAVAALSRSELILLAPLVAVPLCLAPRARAWRPRLEQLVLAGVGSLLLVGPWVGYNLTRFEHPVYLSAGLEITQAVSNCDDTYEGQFLGYWSYRCQIAIDDAATARGLDRNEESVRSRYMGEAAREYMSEHRGEIPKVVLARLGRILGVYRATQQLGFDAYTEARPVWAARLATWGYWVLAPLAVAGAVIARRRRNLIYPLVAVVGTVLFAVVITFAGTRYRAPAEPVIALFAAVFLDRAIPRRRAAPAEPAVDASSVAPVPVLATASTAASGAGAAPLPTDDSLPDAPPSPADEAVAAPVPAGHRHLPNLDGLRALAALAVLTAHVSIATGIVRPERTSNPLRPILPRLDVGVAVFFVLSGFLLFRPFAVALLDRRPGPGVRGYAWRRLLRIFPLYWLVLAVQIAINHYQGLDPQRFGSFPSPGELFAYATLTHIYRSATAIGPIGQAWSLATEVSFYLFLPLFAAGLALVLRRTADERARLRVLVLSLVGLAVIATATKLAVAATTGVDNTTTRGMITTWLPFNLDLFAAGMGLAVASIWWDRHPSGRPAWLEHRRLPAVSWGLAAVALWVVSTQLDLRPDHFLYTDSQLLTRQTLYGIVGVLLLVPAVFGRQDEGWIRRFLSSSVLVALGLASYGIYLWHQLVGGEYYHLLAHQLFNTEFWPALAAIVAGSVSISLLTYRLVEEPLQRCKGRFGDRR